MVHFICKLIGCETGKYEMWHMKHAMPGGSDAVQACFLCHHGTRCYISPENVLDVDRPQFVLKKSPSQAGLANWVWTIKVQRINSWIWCMKLDCKVEPSKSDHLTLSVEEVNQLNGRDPLSIGILNILIIIVTHLVIIIIKHLDHDDPPPSGHSFDHHHKTFWPIKKNKTN